MKKVLLAIALMAVLGGQNAFAGDCNKVKFQFTNKKANKLEVVKILYGSNEEQITNAQLNGGSSPETYTTGENTLGKLDSGSSAVFKVVYHYYDNNNKTWHGCEAGKLCLTKTEYTAKATSASKGTVTDGKWQCKDDSTLKFEIK